MWQRIKKFFKDSETIAFAWFNMALGAIASVLTYADPELVKAVIKPEWVPFFVLGYGVAMKWLRERRADDM